MTLLIDITGDKYGRLLVLSEAKERSPTGRVRWHCICDCGTEIVKTGDALRSGNTKSCGCFRREYTSHAFSTHRRTETKTYEVWCRAKCRVTNRNSKNWDHYGGRGITMCDRWLNSFEAFLYDMGECPPGLSLDRINNDGNYENGNCRWITMAEQASNKRNNIHIEHRGKTLTMAQYCRALTLDYRRFAQLHRSCGLSVVMATAKTMSFQIRQAMKGKRPWPKFIKTMGGIAKEQLK